MALKVGEEAPQFKLPSTGGSKFDLSELKEPVILFFYPQDFTPGCTKEACSFRDNFDVFNDLDVKVVGISTDSLTQHEKFKKKHDLPFELLADQTGKVCKAYDAKVPFLNLAKRITYLIDNDKKIAAVYSDMFGAEKHIKKMISKVSRV